jgi:hypothetical protein
MGRATSARRHRRRALLVAPVAVLGFVAAGCGGTAAPPAATAPPTPLARLNATALDIPRIDFCSLLPRVAIRQALGGNGWTRDHWGNGDRTDVAGTTDVVAEHGCRWRADAGTAQASAWVFAGPVDRTTALEVVRQARTETACHVVAGPPYGDPSLTQVCAVPGNTRVRHAGLFGDSWLTCEVLDAKPVAAVRARADAWCVEVANALNTSD